MSVVQSPILEHSQDEDTTSLNLKEREDGAFRGK